MAGRTMWSAEPCCTSSAGEEPRERNRGSPQAREHSTACTRSLGLSDLLLFGLALHLVLLESVLGIDTNHWEEQALLRGGRAQTHRLRRGALGAGNSAAGHFWPDKVAFTNTRHSLNQAIANRGIGHEAGVTLRPDAVHSPYTAAVSPVVLGGKVGGGSTALPREAGSDDDLLQLLVHHASAVYVEDRLALAAWNCSRCTIPPVQNFHLTSLIFDPEALLQAYVGVHHDKRMVVVCFRGTHSTYIKNWIDDLWALELDLNFPGVDHAYVHRGFYYAYHKSLLKPKVTEEVLRLLAANPDYPVAITGHSLGGALSSICGLDLVLNCNVPSEKVWVATFGSPRVGNSVFAAFFNKTLPYSVRVTHGRDVVVHLPPHTPKAGILSYHHVAQELWYHRVSFFSSVEVYQACDASGEDLACSRSVPGSSILDHLTYLGVSLCSVPEARVEVEVSRLAS